MRSRFVLVNYNSAEWLQRSLQSIIEHSDAEVSVVDNGSNDSSFKEARRLLHAERRIHWVENNDNVGFARANNQVLKYLKEPFAVLMNPDCELQAGTMHAMHAAFAQAPKLGLASCLILNLDGSIQETCKRRFPTLKRIIAQYINSLPANKGWQPYNYGSSPMDPSKTQKGVEQVEAISGAFMMVRKAALSEVGLLDETYFMHFEDLDWCQRFALSEWSVGFVQGGQVVHAKGVSGRSQPIKVLRHLHQSMWRYYKKHYAPRKSVVYNMLVHLAVGLSFCTRSAAMMLRKGLKR